jgi:hypothetical protein
MIIDAILDAKNDGEYMGLKYLYDQSVFFGFDSLANAIDCGENSDIQRELCKYIDSEGYNQELKEFVNSFNWLLESKPKPKVLGIAKEYINTEYFKQFKQN